MHGGRHPRLNAAIGRDQLVKRNVPGRLADDAQSLGRAAREHIPADPVAAHQPRARLAHGVQPLKPHLEPERQFLCRWLLLRSEEHTSELQSLMRISYAVFCLTKKTPH